MSVSGKAVNDITLGNLSWANAAAADTGKVVISATGANTWDGKDGDGEDVTGAIILSNKISVGTITGVDRTSVTEDTTFTLLDITGSTGNDSVTVGAIKGFEKEVISINTGGGADTITVATAANNAGTINLTGGAGADSIVATIGSTNTGTINLLPFSRIS